MKKNRILTLVITYICCALFLVGCKNSTASNTVSNKNEQMSIVCTTFPQYDWVRNIIGDKTEEFDLTLLLDNGVDLHSYQPTAEDIAKIASADVFIYVGGESDGWVEDVLKEATNKDMQVINLLESLGDNVKEEEVVEGMQEEEHHHDEADEHDDSSDEHHDDEQTDSNEEHHHDKEEIEYDEHVWLSLKNVKILVNVISTAISQADEKNVESYTTNTNTYIEKLDELDKQYESMVTSAKFDTILFGDRFPFRYLVDDYDLNYYAAFVACSAETEASFETITFLAEKVDELGVNCILVIENSNQKIAETIKQNTTNKNQTILILNSIQSITKKELNNGFTYLKAMQDNLEVLKKALN